jgi:hypothetical protein
MITIFRQIEARCQELESMRVLAQTGEIMYRQKGELNTAERFKKVENGLAKAIRVLEESVVE